jgi:hypothetical protein
MGKAWTCTSALMSKLKKRETGHIQSPALTLDPKPIYFYAEVFILTTVFVYTQVLAVGHELFFFA